MGKALRVGSEAEGNHPDFGSRIGKPGGAVRRQPVCTAHSNALNATGAGLG